MPVFSFVPCSAEGQWVAASIPGTTRLPAIVTSLPGWMVFIFVIFVFCNKYSKDSLHYLSTVSLYLGQVTVPVLVLYFLNVLFLTTMEKKKRNKAVIVYNAFGSSGPGCVGLGSFPCLSSFLCHWLVLTALAPRMLCILPSAGDYWPNSLLRFASEGACCRNCLHCGLCLLVGSLLTVTHAWGEAT